MAKRISSKLRPTAPVSDARTQHVSGNSGSGNNKSAPPWNYEETAQLAYSFWEARGRQGGSPQEDWFRAEQELRSRLQSGNRREA